MTNPLVNAFFLGRATAEVLSEELGHGLTNAISHVSKFDAEQRERLRQFTQQVVTRAEAEASSATQTHSSGNSTTASTVNDSDVQEIIDELRAEIAQLRAALQDYRQKSGT